MTLSNLFEVVVISLLVKPQLAEVAALGNYVGWDHDHRFSCVMTVTSSSEMQIVADIELGLRDEVAELFQLLFCSLVRHHTRSALEVRAGGWRLLLDNLVTHLRPEFEAQSTAVIEGLGRRFVNILVNSASAGFFRSGVSQSNSSADENTQRVHTARMNAFYEMAQNNRLSFEAMMSDAPARAMPLIRGMQAQEFMTRSNVEPCELPSTPVPHDNFPVHLSRSEQSNIAVDEPLSPDSSVVTYLSDTESCQSFDSWSSSQGDEFLDAEHMEDGPRPERQGAVQAIWEEQLFLTLRGNINSVLDGYLSQRPFLMRSKSSKENRMRQELWCARRYQGTASPGAVRIKRPSWKKWPHYTCPMGKMLVVESGLTDDKRCFFYGSREACKSQALADDSSLSPAEVFTIWERDRSRGEYGLLERRWLEKTETEEDHPSLSGNIRDLISALTKRKLKGLRIDKSLEEIRRPGEEAAANGIHWASDAPQPKI
ncbi:hypothetical protein FOL47_011289 [Perkinsus chesapeaki]|uniref:ELMO CED-12 domain containing n=1 Tax=Perkinsus chesapeaki TaxID=330153 RepID=A0A7J6MMN5_PERCH|nr:hypothetical protein FOL47_011289 [Perkinsus chesapeaki]